MNKNKPNTNPKQRIKMLIRRIQTQKRIITSLEERNYHLVTELNDTKVAMANTTNEYNKLMSKNYEQAVHLNHNQDERLKLKATMDELDVEAISALKSLGSASEVLLNLKKIISHIKTGISEYKPEGTIVLPSPPFSFRNEISLSAEGTIVLPSSPFSSRNEISLSDSVEVKRNQAAVSPMVKGYVISNPTITLERLRLNDIGGVIEPGKSIDTRGELSPIPEETAEAEPIRTRLGRRGQLPQQFTERAASKLNEFIPEAHAEPVVRLSDVSRLLSNTSWLNVNYTPPNKDNTTYTSPSTSSAPSVSGINVFSTDTITLRERKKGKRTNKVIGIDKIESSSGSSENLKVKDSKPGIMGTENNDDKSCEYKNSKTESSESVNNEENTMRFVNSGISVENSESRNSTLRSFTEINEVNTSKYKNSRKRPINVIAESSFSINDEGTSNKSSSFGESKFTINASDTVNEIEECMGRETIIKINGNSNEENFSKCKNFIVCSDIESTSKYDPNVLSVKENDEKMSTRNIKASVEKMEEDANNYSIEMDMSKFTNSKKLDTGNLDVVSSTPANKQETSDEQRSKSRGTFLIAEEIDNGSSRTYMVRNSNIPVSQEDSIINCTRLLPELGFVTSNETEKENTVIEQSSMNPTTSVKSSLLGVGELKRPKSTRIKKPTIKVLEAVCGDINEGSFQIKRNSNRANRVSQKNSKCVAESDASSANSVDSKTSEMGGTCKRTSSRIKKTVCPDEPLTNVAESDASSANTVDSKTSEVGGTCKRSSSRIKKTVVYRDEPLTKEEMKKILRKGLKKHTKIM